MFCCSGCFWLVAWLGGFGFHAVFGLMRCDAVFGLMFVCCLIADTFVM